MKKVFKECSSVSDAVKKLSKMMAEPTRYSNIYNCERYCFSGMTGQRTEWVEKMGNVKGEIDSTQKKKEGKEMNH